jgi:zinc protease
VIAIVGGVDPQRLVDLAARYFSGWQNPDYVPFGELPSVNPLLKLERKHVNIPGKSQTDLIIGAAGPSRRAPDFIAASLGNNLFGQFGLYGRIGQVVRQQAGLAYYSYSSLSGGEGPGPWDVSAGINPQNIEQAVGLIVDEITRFTSEPPTLDELDDSKSNFIGRLPLALESNGGVAGMLLNLERYSLGLDYYRRYPDLVKAVTPEAVLEAARHYLDPQRLAVASAGP